MGIRFTKMHGLGNDFMVIDAVNQRVQLSKEQIALLADRHRGVGFDQCLLLEKSTQPGVDFHYRIYNADGSEVGQCGNGARCMGRFIHHYGLSDKKKLVLATTTTSMQVILNEDQTVTVDMGKPLFTPEKIPLNQDAAESYSIDVDDHHFQFHALSVGNPHAVIQVEQLDKTAVDKWGQRLSTHPVFPEGANIGFMELLSHQRIRLRVYERGCGETKACGSGAVAAGVVARRYFQLDDPVQVSLPGGELFVSWPDETGAVSLTGPVSFVYEGQILS